MTRPTAAPLGARRNPSIMHDSKGHHLIQLDMEATMIRRPTLIEIAIVSSIGATIGCSDGSAARSQSTRQDLVASPPHDGVSTADANQPSSCEAQHITSTETTAAPNATTSLSVCQLVHGELTGQNETATFTVDVTTDDAALFVVSYDIDPQTSKETTPFPIYAEFAPGPHLVADIPNGFFFQLARGTYTVNVKASLHGQYGHYRVSLVP